MNHVMIIIVLVLHSDDRRERNYRFKMPIVSII